jgi:hypothetical protein
MTVERVPVFQDDIDFGWWQPAGQTGIRLSWNRTTEILYLHHAASEHGSYDEVLAIVGSAPARYLGERWLEPGHGPDWVRAQLAAGL